MSSVDETENVQCAQSAAFSSDSEEYGPTELLSESETEFEISDEDDGTKVKYKYYTASGVKEGFRIRASVKKTVELEKYNIMKRMCKKLKEKYKTERKRRVTELHALVLEKKLLSTWNTRLHDKVNDDREEFSELVSASQEIKKKCNRLVRGVSVLENVERSLMAKEDINVIPDVNLCNYRRSNRKIKKKRRLEMD